MSSMDKVLFVAGSLFLAFALTLAAVKGWTVWVMG